MDIVQSSAAQADGGGHIAQAALHQHNVSGVNRNIRTGANGNTDIRAGQGRCIVDAVAHHGHAALVFQAADHSFLAIGQHTGNHFVHTGLCPNGFGGTLVIAGQHHNTDAHALQFTHSLRAVLLDDVRHRDNALHGAILGKEQRGLALGGQCFGAGCHLLRHRHAKGLHQLGVAAVQGTAVQHSRQAVAGQSLEICHLGGGQVVFLCLLQHSAGQRVFTLLLQGSGKAHQYLLRHTVCGQDIRHARLAAGDGASFIQGNDLGFTCLLQRNRGFEENAVFSAHTIANHNGNRRCQAQRAGAADDQH